MNAAAAATAAGAAQRKRIKFWTAAIALRWLISYSNHAEVKANSDILDDLSPDQLKRMDYVGNISKNRIFFFKMLLKFTQKSVWTVFQMASRQAGNLTWEKVVGHSHLIIEYGLAFDVNFSSGLLHHLFSLYVCIVIYVEIIFENNLFCIQKSTISSWKASNLNAIRN